MVRAVGRIALQVEKAVGSVRWESGVCFGPVEPVGSHEDIHGF